MESFREQLRLGHFTSTPKPDLKKRIHKFFGNYDITEDGFCDYEVPEGNYFLLKRSRS